MGIHAGAFLIALILAALLTPLVLWIALRTGAVTLPGGRHVHVRKIPRLGGVAIAVSTLTPLVLLMLLTPDATEFAHQNLGKVAGLLAGSIIVCCVGAIDDIRPVAASNKLLLHVAAAGLAFAVGFRIQAVYLPYFGVVEMGVFAAPITIAWIIGITNAVNLIDGLDGLAAGVVFFAAATNLVVALVGGYHPGQAMIALLMASLMGALLGFLFYNFNPARIFMGDSGSYFLGFVLATSSLLAPMQKTSTAVALLAPVVALGVPIFDTLFSVVRRYLEKRPVFSPDRGHIHHRLLEMGVTHRRAVLSLYAVSILLGASAVAIALGRDWEVGLALFLATTVMVALVKFVGYFQYAHARIRRTERFYDENVQLLRRTLPEGMLRLHLARNQTQIDRALKWFIDHLKPMEIRLEDAHGRAHLSWGGDGSNTAKQVVCNRSTFNAGPSNLRLVFEFPSDVALSAQAEVLLQLLADQMHRSLVATRSALVTAPDPTSQPAAAEPKASLA